MPHQAGSNPSNANPKGTNTAEESTLGYNHDQFGEAQGPSIDRETIEEVSHVGELVSALMVNGKTFVKCLFNSSLWKGETYKDVTFGENCDGDKMRVEDSRLINFNADGLNKIGALINTFIGKGTLMKNLDQRGSTMAGLSFELNGKEMTSAELLEYAKSSDTAKAEVETLLKSTFEGTLWDNSTKMDPALRELFQMVSSPVENVSARGTVITSRSALENVLNQFPLVEGEEHDLSKPVTIRIPGQEDVEIRISPKRSLTDTLLLRKSEPEAFVLEVIDRSKRADSPMEVVGHGGERRAKPLKLLGVGKGKDRSQPLNPAELVDLIADLARTYSPTSGGEENPATAA
ncbi:MAG: hypothetical protein ACO3XO_07995 [Bdellovibrionota bacterium]